MDGMEVEDAVGVFSGKVVGWGTFSLSNSFKTCYFSDQYGSFQKSTKNSIAFSANVYQNGQKILELLL